MNEERLKRWLLLSLVLNLFIVGGVAGGAVRWWITERGAAASAAEPPQRGLRYAADELSAEQRRTFRLSLREARNAAAEPIQVAKEGRAEVLRLMREPQFDHVALTQALARTREADMVSRARFETTVVDFAKTLSPGERQKFANGLARRSAQTPPAATPPKS